MTWTTTVKPWLTLTLPPPVIGRWTTTSTYDVYMVDNPKDTSDGANNGYGTPKRDSNKPSEEPPKCRKQRRRFKERRGTESNTGTREDDTPDNVEDLDDPAPEQQLDGSWGHGG